MIINHSEFEMLSVKLVEQIMLVGVSVFFALLIGLPLGVISAHHQFTKRIIFAVINFLQTIPSLALLTLLLPAFGIGAKPAIVALSVYALLPIVRNTTVGIKNIAPPLREAALGLGMTFFERLLWVELPLAMPVIIGGVKTATTLSVGTATLAAFIGAGGLGDFINQGLSMNNYRLIMLGAIPAALLALFLDFLIGFMEKSLKNRREGTGKSMWPSSLSAVAAVCLVGFLSFMFVPHGDVVTIGSKDFTEQLILSEMMAELIEHKTDLKVRRRFNLGSSVVCHKALLHGDIDIYPEYTGSASMIILHHPEKRFLSSQALFDYVSKEYDEKYFLSWLPPFGFHDDSVLLVTEKFAEKNHVSKMSELTPLSSHLRFGTLGECLHRADCLPGLRSVYHYHFAKIREMAMSLTYQALDHGKVDVITGISTDGRIKLYHLKPLADDRHLYPNFLAAPIVRNETLLHYPQLKSALSKLAGKIDDKTMMQLNYAVDVQKKSYQVVAHQFLLEKGLL